MTTLPAGRSKKLKAIESIADLTPDPANTRRHNPRNIGSIVNSLQKVGAARSIVIDENDVILAGNGLVEAAGEAGITKLKIVEADGNTVIAVRRTGLTPKQKAELAIADNRTAELADWDTEQLLKTIAEYKIELADVEFAPYELEQVTANDPNAEWKGMPEFQHEDKTAFKSLTVHFKNQKAVDRFAKLVGQKITADTRYVWIPKIEVESYADKRYAPKP